MDVYNWTIQSPKRYMQNIFFLIINSFLSGKKKVILTAITLQNQPCRNFLFIIVTLNKIPQLNINSVTIIIDYKFNKSLIFIKNTALNTFYIKQMLSFQIISLNDTKKTLDLLQNHSIQLTLSFLLSYSI